MNKKIEHSEITVFYGSLPISPSPLCFTLYCGHISSKMVAQKHVQFQLVVSWHSLVDPRKKQMVYPFLAALLHLSVYCIVYHIMALVLRYVSHREKLHCWSPQWHIKHVVFQSQECFFSLEQNQYILIGSVLSGFAIWTVSTEKSKTVYFFI